MDFVVKTMSFALKSMNFAPKSMDSEGGSQQPPSSELDASGFRGRWNCPVAARRDGIALRWRRAGIRRREGAGGGAAVQGCVAVVD